MRNKKPMKNMEFKFYFITWVSSVDLHIKTRAKAKKKSIEMVQKLKKC